MKLSLGRIAEYLAVPEAALGANFPRDRVATGYSIDSRTLRAGEVFFAVRGEKLDGHDFLEQALERGAAAAVVSREKTAGRARAEAPQPWQPALIQVEDTLLALQALARSVRRQWGRPLIAVTGSAGKTTTKDAIACLLSTKFRVRKSQGNFNNHFGLPLMLLKLEPDDDCAVVELGMSHLGEIAALAEIAQPETGVVTNVAPVHLEFFKDISEIARAKYELIEALPPTGTAILNADDPYVSQFGRSFPGRVITYGAAATAMLRAENIESRAAQGSGFDLRLENRRESARLPLVGVHNVWNALAAVAVALDQGVELRQAVEALAGLEPADKRGQVVSIASVTVINDCYNSNPKALDAMVDALAEMPAQRRIVVAGEMLELGPLGETLHRQCGRHMAEQGVDVVLGVRGLAGEIVNAAQQGKVRAEFVESPEEAGRWLARETRDGDVVLLKASRGVKLEKALEVWERARGPRSKLTTNDQPTTT